MGNMSAYPTSAEEKLAMIVDAQRGAPCRDNRAEAYAPIAMSPTCPRLTNPVYPNVSCRESARIRRMLIMISRGIIYDSIIPPHPHDAPWPENQEHDQQPERDEILVLRREQENPPLFSQAKHKRADDSPWHAADSANHRCRKALDHQFIAHVWIYPLLQAYQYPPYPGDGSGQHEGQRIDPL